MLDSALGQQISQTCCIFKLFIIRNISTLVLLNMNKTESYVSVASHTLFKYYQINQFYKRGEFA